MPEPSRRYPAVPSTLPPPPASQKPQRRLRYREKAKSSPETSTILDSINHVDPHITTFPSLDAPEAEGLNVPDELKLSPIIDLINKRLKAISKKIARIEYFASTDPQHVNADQKRFMRTLPTQQAIQKELNEVKKAIEAQEADLAHEPVAGTLEAEETEGADAVPAQVEAVPPRLYSQLQETFVTKTIDLLNLLRYSLLASGKLDTLSTDKIEGSIIDGVADALLGMDEGRRRATVEGFLQGSGDFDGLSYTLLIEIAKAGLALHCAPTPAQEAQEETVAEPETAADVTIAGIPEGLPKTKRINFVQESEIGSFGTSEGTSAPRREARRRAREGAERKEAELLQRPEWVAPVQEAAGERQNKRKDEPYKREEDEQRRPEMLDQLKQDRAKAERKKGKEEQRRGDRVQRWLEEWQQVEQLNRDRAEKGETSWKGLEIQTWEDEKVEKPMEVEQRNLGGRKATRGAQRQRRNLGGKINRAGKGRDAVGTTNSRQVQEHS